MKLNHNELISWITGQDYFYPEEWLKKTYSIDLDVGHPDNPLALFYGRYFQIIRTVFIEKLDIDISRYCSFNEMLDGMQEYEAHEELGFFISWLKTYSDQYIVSRFQIDIESLQTEELLNFFEYYMVNMKMAFDSKDSDYETFLKQLLNISVKLNNKIEELKQFVFTFETESLIFMDEDIDLIRETPIEQQEVSLYV